MKKIIIFVCMFTFIFIGVRSVAISNEGEAYINSVYTDMLEQIKEDSDIEEMNFNNSFYRYSYDINDPEKPFADHFSDEFGFWFYLNDEGCYSTYWFDNSLNKWVPSGESHIERFVDKDGVELNLTCSLNGFMEFAENKFDGDIDELKITSRGFGNEYATYIYFTSNDAAYVIPLALQAEISCGLVSGEIYDAEVAKKMFDDTIVYSDEPVGGGTATDTAEPEALTQQNVADKAEKQETSSVDKKEDNLLPDSPENTTDYTVYIAVGVGVLVLAAAVVTLALLKKKR